MKGAAVALLALALLAGCGDEDRTDTEATPANDRNAVATDDANPPLTEVARDRPDTIVRRPAPARLDLGLLTMPSAEETLTGTVEIAGKGRSSSVTVRLNQGTGRTSYDGAIRLGDCSQLGATVASLIPATLDSLGVGASQSDITIPMDSLVNTRMAVVYGRGGRPAACGAIPQYGTP
jgi:hypothetical protein